MLGEKPSDWPVVLTIHGIRTTGDWQRELTDVLTQCGFRHMPLGFGFFKAISLLMPWSRAKKVEWFRRVYSEKFVGSNRTPSVIAHSFGSYIVTQAMLKYDDIRFDKIILCGSIVDRKYPWSVLLEQRGQVNAVLNQAGGRDIWAKLVEWVVSDAGSSGVSGFEDTAGGRLIQLIHERHEHSDYFYQQNYEQRWIPFLRGESVRKVISVGSDRFNWKFALIFTSFLISILVVFAAVLPNLKNAIRLGYGDNAPASKELLVVEQVELPKIPEFQPEGEPFPIEELPPLPPPESELIKNLPSTLQESRFGSGVERELVAYLSGIWVHKSRDEELLLTVNGHQCKGQSNTTTELRFNDAATTSKGLLGRWEKLIKLKSEIGSENGMSPLQDKGQCADLAGDQKDIEIVISGEILVPIEERINWGKIRMSASTQGCRTDSDTETCSEHLESSAITGDIQRINLSQIRIGDQIFQRW